MVFAGNRLMWLTTMSLEIFLPLELVAEGLERLCECLDVLVSAAPSQLHQVDFVRVAHMVVGHGTWKVSHYDLEDVELPSVSGYF